MSKNLKRFQTLVESSLSLKSPLLVNTLLRPIINASVSHVIGAKAAIHTGLKRSHNFKPRGELVTLSDPKQVRPSNIHILYIHGGGFIALNPSHYRSFTASIAKATGCPVFSPRYRLAPTNRFPTQVEDVVTAYRFILEGGIDAQQVIMVGDGVGGTLVASAILHLARDSELPIPGAGVLLNPWLDLVGSDMTPSRYKCAPYESVLPTQKEVLNTVVRWYCETQEVQLPLVSPLYAESEQLSQFPPMYIESCMDSILRDDGKEFHKKLTSAEGSTFRHLHRYHLVKAGVPHGYQVMLGSDHQEVKNCTNRIAEFVTHVELLYRSSGLIEVDE
eukprot:PhF_6_TR23737/c0_g1_i1/m.33152/K14731/mlhB, chnC; epsilon-lactone hydrolase